MSKSDAERKADSRKANAANGRKEFPQPPAIKAALERICDRSQCEDWREALSLAVINLDAMDDELFALAGEFGRILPSAKIGKRRVILVSDLTKWVAEFGQQAEGVGQ